MKDRVDELFSRFFGPLMLLAVLMAVCAICAGCVEAIDIDEAMPHY